MDIRILRLPLQTKEDPISLENSPGWVGESRPAGRLIVSSLVSAGGPKELRSAALPVLTQQQLPLRREDPPPFPLFCLRSIPDLCIPREERVANETGRHLTSLDFTFKTGDVMVL